MGELGPLLMHAPPSGCGQQSQQFFLGQNWPCAAHDAVISVLQVAVLIQEMAMADSLPPAFLNAATPKGHEGSSSSRHSDKDLRKIKDGVKDVAHDVRQAQSDVVSLSLA